MKRLSLGVVLLLMSLSACTTEFGGAGSGGEVREVLVERFDLLTLESYPVQVQARIFGAFRNTCERLRDVTRTRENETFFVTLTVREEDEGCAQVLVPFEKSVALETYGLPPGSYTVNVNGVTETFTLP